MDNLTMTIKCKICHREHENYKGLSSHLKVHNLSKKDYYDEYLLKEGEGICHNENCNNETNFISLNQGYNLFCSVKCAQNSKKVREKIEKTNLEKFGYRCSFQSPIIRQKFIDNFREKYSVDNPFQLKEVKEKSKKTNLEKRGFEYACQSEAVKEKSKKTCLENYGVENPMQSKEVQDKYTHTCLKKYGVEYPMQSKYIQNKFKNTLMKNYGVNSPLKSKIVRIKFQKTCIRNYNVDNPSKSKLIKEKKRISYILKYNVDNPSKSSLIKEKKKETCLKHYNVPYAWQSSTFKDNYRLRFYNKLINSNRLQGIIKPNFLPEEFIHCGLTYSWTCLKCNTIFEDDLGNGKIPRCPKCFPSLNGTSKFEQDLFEFIKSLNIEVFQHNRTIIRPKELDIFIPSHNLAIEFNGLFWHSELGGKHNQNYHLNKTLECQEKGIQLIHIFEDEWLFKQNIIKSIIKSKLNLITNKIFARKCTIKIPDSNQAFNFLESNHLQGYINGTHLGLYFNNELVSILTYGKPRFNKNYEVEIYRFCNKIDTIIVGGLSKLIKCLNSKSILTYVDLRYGTGISYLKSDFKLISKSNPNYYYMKNYQHRESRLKYQKHKLKDKLEIFDENLTEWQNMQLNNYDRIWDCGNLIFGSFKPTKKLVSESKYDYSLINTSF